MKTFRMVFASLFVVSVVAVGSFAATASQGPVKIILVPSATSPQFVGTSISWTATVQNPIQGHLYNYQFAVSFQNQNQIVRDYSPTKRSPGYLTR